MFGRYLKSVIKSPSSLHEEITNLLFQYKSIKSNAKRAVRYGIGQSMENTRFKKGSDTLFILGSGPSINKYTYNKWDKIKSNDSFGFNFWILHEHVPDYYMFYISASEKTKKTSKLLIENINERKKDYSDVSVILKRLHGKTPYYKNVKELSNKLPKYLLDNLIIANNLMIHGGSDLFRKTIRLAYYMGSFNRKLNRYKFLLQKCGSLMSVIHLSILIGYKNIVLCGVDLNVSGYFYDEKRRKYKENGLKLPAPTHSSGSAHNTFDNKVKDLTMDKVIYEIKNVVADPMGIEIYTGSKSSAIYPSIPYYFGE